VRRRGHRFLIDQGFLDDQAARALTGDILEPPIHHILALIYAVVLNGRVKEGTMFVVYPRHVKASVVRVRQVAGSVIPVLVEEDLLLDLFRLFAPDKSEHQCGYLKQNGQVSG